MGTLTLRLPLVEDLILLKTIARTDLADVAVLLAAHPQLDIERVRHELSACAAPVAMSDVLEYVEPRPANGDT